MPKTFRRITIFCSFAFSIAFGLSLLPAAEIPAPTGESIVSPDAKLELLYTRTAPIQGGLTEGPAVAPDGSIYFTDIPMGQDKGLIVRFDPKTKKTSIFTNDSSKANGLVFAADGSLLACEGSDYGGRRVSRWDIKTGRRTTVADNYDGKKFNAPNDLCLDRKGRIYFTDPRYLGDEPRELTHRAVYRIDEGGKVTEVTHDISKPNGIALSPDGKTLYVADHDNGSDKIDPSKPAPKQGPMKIYGFPLGADGLVAGERKTIVDFGEGKGCDGMTLDSQGNLYLTVRNPQRPGVLVVTSTGKELVFIPTGPARQMGTEPVGLPSNVEFGSGDESNVLYITVDKSLYRIGLKSKGLNMQTVEETFGAMPDGRKVTLFTCTNSQGSVMKVTDYGARLVSLEVPDRQKKRANVTLGFNSLEGYLKHTAFFGCTTGRFANRIAKGKFTLDGREYTLATNNGLNHLHGGLKGFDKAVWKAKPVANSLLKSDEATARGVEFTYRSVDGEEGYPGNLDVTVTYLLTDDNELEIKYEAKTDKTTVLNLTNHAYWNLAGAGAANMLDHVLMLAADKYLPVDAGAIPLGAPANVKGTVMDFTTPHTIGERIADVKNEKAPSGYDHCYVLRSQDGSLALAARVKHPVSGRVMEVLTTEPAIQLYASLHLNGSEANGGYQQYGAFCLETQHYPDSPNRPEYPTTVLKPGEIYRQTTIYKFTTE